VGEETARVARELGCEYLLASTVGQPWKEKRNSILDSIIYVLRSIFFPRDKKPDQYLDTYEEVCKHLLVCEEKGWKTLLVMAHRHHLWRTYMVLKKKGYEVVVAPGCENISYDPESKQCWTWGGWIFIPREVLARLFYLFTGKI
jgi:hypothetical protein